MLDPEESIPITERSNPLTTDIDLSTSCDFICLLHQCDSQIFDGWDSYRSRSIFSQEVVQSLQHVSEEAVDIFKRKNPASASIVFSGCGTSGRIAFLIAKSINDLLINIGYKACCDYIIAGEDKALLTSQESPEDSPHAGMQALEKICKAKKKVLFIGITCGLSAPFVAGQLSYCMEHLDIFTPVLLGFNPIEQARNCPIEGWHETFLSVVTKLLVIQDAGKGYIINPIIGPEAITGSSRMKGGTTTKLLLEIIMLAALRTIPSSIEPSEETAPITASPTVSDCTHLMHMYEAVWKETYPQALAEGLAQVIDWAGASLNSAGHVYYIGMDSIGVLGLVDASECPPTFGADLDNVRGFLFGGYESLENREGNLVLSPFPPVQTLLPIETKMRPASVDIRGGSSGHLQISADYFTSTVVPSLTPADTVIFLTSTGSQLHHSMRVLAPLVQTRCSQVAVFVCYRDVSETQDVLPQYFQHVLRIRIPITQHIRDFMGTIDREPWWFDLLGVHAARRFAAELSCKLLLNAVSTGAHIQRGKVFHNLMVDLKLSNSKLFQRGIDIVKNLAVCSEYVAVGSILRSLYGTNVISEELRQVPVSEHTRISSFKSKVIPTALILASKGCLIHEAMEVLLKFPIIREALLNLWVQPSHSSMAGVIS